MKSGISSRLAGIKCRLVGFSLKETRHNLQKLERALRLTSNGVKSIELSHKKLLSSSQLGEKFRTHHDGKRKQMESLQGEVEIKQKELQKSIHLEERWKLFYAETRGHEIAIKEAIQSEDLIDSHITRAATGLDNITNNLTKVVQSPVTSQFEASSEPRQEAQASVAKDTADEAKLPVITELVEGRVFARLQRDGDSLHITLITQSVKDQQLLNRFRRKYARIAQDQGSRNASIRVERRRR